MIGFWEGKKFMADLLFKRFKDDKTVLNFVSKPSFTFNEGNCFYYYYLQYDGQKRDDNFYFGFYASPNIINLADEINLKFKNIKIVFIDLNRSDDIKDITNLTKKYSLYVFRVELDGKYSKESNFMLNLSIAQFLRVACPQYTHYLYYKTVEDNFIESTIGIFNKTSNTYGTWSVCQKFSSDLFYRLDDIDIMNKLNKGIDMEEMPLNSTLIKKIIKYLVNQVKENET